MQYREAAQCYNLNSSLLDGVAPLIAGPSQCNSTNRNIQLFNKLSVTFEPMHCIAIHCNDAMQWCNALHWCDLDVLWDPWRLRVSCNWKKAVKYLTLNPNCLEVSTFQQHEKVGKIMNHLLNFSITTISMLKCITNKNKKKTVVYLHYPRYN